MSNKKPFTFSQQTFGELLNEFHTKAITLIENKLSELSIELSPSEKAGLLMNFIANYTTMSICRFARSHNASPFEVCTDFMNQINEGIELNKDVDFIKVSEH